MISAAPRAVDIDAFLGLQAAYLIAKMIKDGLASTETTVSQML